MSHDLLHTTCHEGEDCHNQRRTLGFEATLRRPV
jgi:hypothetical protein